MEDLEIVAKQTGTAILDFDGKVLKVWTWICDKATLIFAFDDGDRAALISIYLSHSDSKATGELALLQDASASVTLSALYHILQDATKCLENDSPRKISVVYSDHNFVLTTTDKNICIAKIQTN